MELRRLRLARDLAVFRDWSSTAEADTDFGRYNLIYGLNGTGKTTLSRLFSSLERGVYCDRLPGGGRFEFELEDGNRCGSQGSIDRLKSRLIVFNTDFVDENFKWAEGTATPVFYIGREQAALGEQLVKVEAELSRAQEQRDRAAADLAKHEGRLTAFKRDTARNIQQQTYSNPYRAPNLDNDYAAEVFGDQHALDAERQKELTRTILQDEPPAAVMPLGENGGAGDLISLLARSDRCLAATVGTIALEDLKSHDTMLRWVSEGIDYHETHALKDCLFCSNTIPDQRLDSLKSSIDGKFEALMSEVEFLVGALQAEEQRLKGALTQLPPSTALSPSLSKAYSAATKSYQDQIGSLARLVGLVVDALREKLKSPTRVFALPTAPADPSALVKALNHDLALINETIKTHNDARDAFSATQAEARRKLRANLLRVSQDDYRSLTAEFQRLKNDKEGKAGEADKLAADASALRHQIQQHGPAAAAINGLIKNYLRHSELQIEAVEEGFHIRRNGEQIAGGVSEGEKTAITFCYFLSCISANGRAAKDTIIVIDDPISSLDSKALNYAFNLMRSYSVKAKQLFVLTHNVHFMNECKKWIKKNDRGRLLCIDMKQAEDETRTSRLVAMPSLLLNFDSEYHYLFKFVNDFAQAGEQHYDYTYLMPNVMRKVLEVFLTFKVPTGADIVSKLDTLSADHKELDAIRLKALNRLVQVESHGDSMDDLVAISPMTVEETRDCAQALIAMMKVVDRRHYDGLASLCR